MAPPQIGETEMGRNVTYAVHYGNGSAGRWNVDPRDFRTFEAARKAAEVKARTWENVVIADTDGGTRTVKGEWEGV
jgi:hypothetical protein